ncbi:hypothetical protein JRG66_13020 [Salinimicrobium tongyeongense]|uniref:Uncharacterized protein n=1 Tax=Salinimicrobium tongyeongense TaxID=2809707 RepID=A0ABY6NPQ0_9FLAO|nr:hypothetical protein [Salinimicrobium tongyeongense]UZH54876.1 hypothetical protein JRG66_13020 [Salinimicrobium tongyeongense]
MSEDLKFIVSILLSSGIVSFVIWIFRKKITSEIENSIKNKYDSKIEGLKNEFATSQSILANSLNTQSEGIKATYEKRLNSLQLYWEDILRIEEYISPLNHFDPIISKKELERIKKEGSDLPKKFLGTVSYAFEKLQIDRTVVESMENKKELEKLRPYLGEKLWLLRFYFNLFVHRIMHLYDTDYHSGTNLTHWMKDEYLKKSLKEILSKEEIEFIYKYENSGIERGVNIFKQKILNEISQTTSGILVGKSTIENAISLSKMIDRDKQNFA